MCVFILNNRAERDISESTNLQMYGIITSVFNCFSGNTSFSFHSRRFDIEHFTCVCLSVCVWCLPISGVKNLKSFSAHRPIFMRARFYVEHTDRHGHNPTTMKARKHPMHRVLAIEKETKNIASAKNLQPPLIE